MRKRLDLVSIFCVCIIVASAILIWTLVTEHTSAEKKMQTLIADRANVSSVVYTASDVVQDTAELPVISDENTAVNVGTADLYNTGLTEDQKVTDIKEGVEILEIPSLELVAPILNGTDSGTLSVALGHFEDSASMGEVGNYCVAGHSSSRATYLFNGLHDVELYSEVYLYDSDGNKYEYYVVSKDTISPSALYVTKNTNDKRLTMITCTDAGKMRLCVTALMLTEDELRDYKIQNNTARIQGMSDLNKLYEDVEITSYMSSRIEPAIIYHSLPESAFKSYSKEQDIGVFKNDI